jgi:hypothetical protein
MSFKPEVSTDGGRTFNQNALVFATEAEALASAKDLFSRWLSCTGYRAVESTEPANYTLKDGVLESVGVVA